MLRERLLLSSIGDQTEETITLQHQGKAEGGGKQIKTNMQIIEKVLNKWQPCIS